jgi:hypothetical protein
MIICACGLIPNLAEVPNFQYKAYLWYSIGRKFRADDEKPQKN